MSHPTEGELQSYLDDEVSVAARAEVEAHLAACSECAGRLAELRTFVYTFSGAASLLDRSAPHRESVLAEVRARDLRARAWKNRFAFSRDALLKAAVLVLGLTTAVVAAVPGSTLNRLLHAVWSDAVDLIRREKPPVVIPAVEPQVPSGPQGEELAQFRVIPAEGRVEISIVQPARGTRVHVQLIDSERAVVELGGEAATARFSSGAGRFQINGGGRGDVRVLLPRDLPNAVIEINGRRMVTKQGADLRFHGQAADTVGAELVFPAL